MPRRHRPRNLARTATALAGLALVLVLVPSCGSDDPPGNYLSIGDSYGQGLQPSVEGDSVDLTNGFTYLLPGKAEDAGWDLNLENFACGGATVESVIGDPGCLKAGRSDEGPAYDVPQLEAATSFLREHPGHVELITVVIGANDIVLPCVTEANDQLACVTKIVDRIEGPLAGALDDLRAAAGPDTVIIGLTYPNMILGSYVADGEPELASQWVTAFAEVINPMLKKQYEGVDGIFVDVTDGMGGNVPFDETTTLDPYGEIPVAVAEVCQLTWYCEGGDVHPTDAGYEAIADMIVEALPSPPEPPTDG